MLIQEEIYHELTYDGNISFANARAIAILAERLERIGVLSESDIRELLNDI